jgi:hypothetical protein
MASRRVRGGTVTSAAPVIPAVQPVWRSGVLSLTAGNVHSAENWRLVLDPVIARYRERGLDLYFRADAASAKPEVYELLDSEGIQYAIRLPANQMLQRRISYLLTRPIGRPPKKPIVFYASLHYQAAGSTRARRVVAKVEWHQDELAGQAGGQVLQPPWDSGAVDQGRQERNSLDATVLPCLTTPYGSNFMLLLTTSPTSCAPQRYPRR